MLTTPLCVVAFGIAGQSPQFAIGFLLPLQCTGAGLHQHLCTQSRVTG